LLICRNAAPEPGASSISTIPSLKNLKKTKIYIVIIYFISQFQPRINPTKIWNYRTKENIQSIQQRLRQARHEDERFEFSRPESKAALTWIAVWLVTLITLAIVPIDEARPNFAAMHDGVHFGHGTITDFDGFDPPYIKAQSWKNYFRSRKFHSLPRPERLWRTDGKTSDLSKI